MQIRLLKTGYRSAADNMAIDEALIEHIANGASPPTLRFYGWRPPAISIGYFQSLEEEVDLDACQKYGIDYVRRITGGGAVLHEDEITYSMHIPESAGVVPNGILESYGKICGGILKGLSQLGLSAQFVPLNDIVLPVNGGEVVPRLAGDSNAVASLRLGLLKKISGNAQTRRNGVILQHGTTLLKVDVEKMFSALKVPSEKLKGKLIDDVKQRVTSLSDVLNREVSFDEACAALQKGFELEFPFGQFYAGELSQSEKSLAQNLSLEKYRSDVWNKKR